jgi:N-acetylmuramoyl-L-alanine amidase
MMKKFLDFIRSAALAVAALGLCGPAAAQAQPKTQSQTQPQIQPHREPAAAARLHSAAAETTPDGARIVLRLDRTVRPRAFLLDNPNRLVVDLPGAVLPPSPSLSDQAQLVSRIRHGALAGGGVRIVFDLAGPAQISAPLRAVDNQPGQFRLALRAQRPAAAAVRPQPAPLAVATPSIAPEAPRDRQRVIVIDPGHGGRDPGAIGRHLGLQEKAVTLKAAQMLADHLRQSGAYTVVLTRTQDRFLELEERVAIARDRHADLFISLHADSNADPSARGASVYTLSERGARRARREMDRHDWEIDLGEESRPAIVEQILVDLTQRETKNRSADFAQAVITRLAPAAPLLRNTHRNAGFFVLLAPDVPAVLIELGFLTNRTDEARLSNDRRLRAKTRAIAVAVDDFFADRSTRAQR